ncbi:MAG TPA: hypothetical protein VKM55_00535 [Candidatus Lokiarchaeia archaeon]|nr:hypothetical protein [Candidatus Lokiarchaeia archaeon]
MVLLIEQINDISYVEIGVGESKSKARKAAAMKVVEASNLIAWLSKKYPDKIL